MCPFSNRRNLTRRVFQHLSGENLSTARAPSCAPSKSCSVLDSRRPFSCRSAEGLVAEVSTALTSESLNTNWQVLMVSRSQIHDEHPQLPFSEKTRVHPASTSDQGYLLWRSWSRCLGVSLRIERETIYPKHDPWDCQDGLRPIDPPVNLLWQSHGSCLGLSGYDNKKYPDFLEFQGHIAFQKAYFHCKYDGTLRLLSNSQCLDEPSGQPTSQEWLKRKHLNIKFWVIGEASLEPTNWKNTMNIYLTGQASVAYIQGGRFVDSDDAAFSSLPCNKM